MNCLCCKGLPVQLTPHVLLLHPYSPKAALAVAALSKARLQRNNQIFQHVLQL